jgi:ankyrin repeat protein
MNIFESIFKGDLNTLKSYIENGGDVNLSNDSGYTLINMSALMKRVEIVNFLKQKGAETDFITDVAIGDLISVEKYLEEGYNVNTINKQGHQAFMIAAHQGNIEMAKLLIKYKSDINAQHKVSGNTALIAAIDQGQNDMVKFLIDCKVNLNVKNNSGKSALEMALDKGNNYIVELLKNAGAK